MRCAGLVEAHLLCVRATSGLFYCKPLWEPLCLVWQVLSGCVLGSFLRHPLPLKSVVWMCICVVTSVTPVLVLIDWNNSASTECPGALMCFFVFFQLKSGGCHWHCAGRGPAFSTAHVRQGACVGVPSLRHWVGVLVSPVQSAWCRALQECDHRLKREKKSWELTCRRAIKAQHRLVQVFQASHTALGPLLFPERCRVTRGLLCHSFTSPRLGQANFGHRSDWRPLFPQWHHCYCYRSVRVSAASEDRVF